MKSFLKIVVGVVAVAVCGCQTYLRTPEQIRADNVEPVEALFEAQDGAGIIAQRTVFEYHFIPGTAALNARGEDVLDALSEYYKEFPGQLSMPSGSESDAIYQSRVNSVQTYLSAQGVDVGTVQITVDRPDAGGISSHDMRALQESNRERSDSEGTDSSTSTILSVGNAG